MSISIVLIPLAFAAIAAAKASSTSDDQTGTVACQVRTRMRDPKLLQDALVGIGARLQSVSDSTIEFALDNNLTAMSRDDAGIWSAHFAPGIDAESALATVRTIDEAYGRRVQSEVLKRLRERAPFAGLRVESETIEDDSSVVLMLSVLDGQ